MSKQPNFFRIGVFVISALGLIVIGIVSISADTLGNDAILMETYFNESVQGLSVGSALTHRGVDIGRVERITFVASEYPMEIGSVDLDQFGRYVMVVVAVNRNKMPGLSKHLDQFAAMMADQVRLGLRLKISYQGITGLAVIETDYVDPGRDDPVKITWKPKTIYIPSTLSMLTSFTQSVDTVFQRLEKIEFEAVINRIESTLGGIETAVKDADVARLRDSVLTLMTEIAETNKKLQVLTGKAETLASGDVPDALQQFTATLGRIEGLIASHEGDIDKILMDVRGFTANLRELTGEIKQDPALLLLSSPPERSEIMK